MGGAPNPRIFPGANTTAQWWESKYSRSTFAYIEKFLLHTTETTGWPAYSSGAVAPTATYHPRQRAVRQHNYVNTSARALVDPTWTPVRENRDRVVQLEIICYSDRSLAQKVDGLWVGDLTDAHYRDIAALIVHTRRHYDGPPLAYPPRENPRMGSSEYDNFRGILGHDDASGNTHWDPGAFSFPRLINAIKALEGTTTAPAPEPPKEWYLMDIPQDNLIQIRDAVLDAPIEHPTLKDADGKPVTWPLRRAVWSDWYYSFFDFMKGAADADVDEAALAQELAPVLAPLITPILGDIVKTAIAEAGPSATPEQVAAAVVQRLGEALAKPAA